MEKYQKEKNRTSTKKEWKHVGIAFLALCIIAFGLGFRSWQDGIFYFDHETETVYGKVTDVIWSPERHNRTYNTVQYTYTFNGQAFRGVEKIAFNKYVFVIDDTILVQVLKRKPEISRTQKN